jgi:hypothetical protein
MVQLQSFAAWHSIIPHTQIINNHVQNFSKVTISCIQPYPTQNCNIEIYTFPSTAGNHTGNTRELTILIW